MQPESNRTSRIAELLKREVAALIQTSVRDPRLTHVTITDANVTRDLSLARIYFSYLRQDCTPKQITDALNQASGYLRRELTSRVDLRVVPQLRFIYDAALQRADDLQRLLDKAMSRK